MVALIRPAMVSDPHQVGNLLAKLNQNRLSSAPRIVGRAGRALAWLAMLLALSLASPAPGSGGRKSNRPDQQEFQRQLKLIGAHDEAAAMKLAEWAYNEVTLASGQGSLHYTPFEQYRLPPYSHNTSSRSPSMMLFSGHKIGTGVIGDL